MTWPNQLIGDSKTFPLNNQKFWEWQRRLETVPDGPSGGTGMFIIDWWQQLAIWQHHSQLWEANNADFQCRCYPLLHLHSQFRVSHLQTQLLQINVHALLSTYLTPMVARQGLSQVICNRRQRHFRASEWESHIAQSDSVRRQQHGHHFGTGLYETHLQKSGRSKSM